MPGKPAHPLASPTTPASASRALSAPSQPTEGSTPRRWSRRRFLLAGAGLTLTSAAGYWWGRKPVNLALIGAGKQGTFLAESLNKGWWFGGRCGRILGVCDVDRGQAQKALAACSGARYTSDYREILDRDDIEGVLIATPDHWHVPIAIEALRRGMAVYCEKPVSLTIAEGQELLRVVNETRGVFLGGTKQRTDVRFRTACELVRQGRLGTVRRVEVTLPQRWQGDSPGPFSPCPVPPELNWNAWLGPAPWAEYCPQRVHGFFRRWYEYSGGQMTDWGAHHLDIVQWALGFEQSGPVRIEARGEMPNIPNGFNTPLVFNVDYTYADGTCVHVQSDAEFCRNGIRIEGDTGWLFVSRDELIGPAVDELSRRPLDSRAASLHETTPARFCRQEYHLIHFLRCIRDGERPVSDAVSQVRTATTCHLGNVALRLGRPLRWDPDREEFLGDDEANRMRSRPSRFWELAA